MKFRKTKYKPLISIKIHFLIQNHHHVHHVENFFFKGSCWKYKPNIFLLELKCGAWRQNGGRLGDVTEAGRPVLRGLEVILQILRLGVIFAGIMAPLHPLPPLKRISEMFNDIFGVVLWKGLIEDNPHIWGKYRQQEKMIF